MKTYTQNHPKARYIFFIFCHANALFALPIPRLAFYLPSKCQCTVCTRQQSNVSTGSRTQCNLVVRELFFPVSLMWLLLLLLGMCAENISRPASQGLNGSTNIGFSWLYLSEFNSTVAHLYKCTNGNCFVRIQLSSDTPF